MSFHMTCPGCGGDGACPRCGGTGEVVDPTPRHLQENDVAVVIDPHGGEHPVRELFEGNAQGALYWCAGMVGRSPEILADRLWATWDRPTTWDSTYERQERAFTERGE